MENRDGVDCRGNEEREQRAVEEDQVGNIEGGRRKFEYGNN